MERVKLKKEFENLNAAKARQSGESYKDKTLDPGGHGVSEFQRSLQVDAEAAMKLATSFSCKMVDEFVDVLEHCPGVVMTSGIGKSGIIAERMSASLASTGTPSHYVHASEWSHGDLGRVMHGDVVIFFSHSGSTKECVHAASLLKERDVKILAIVGKAGSLLEKLADACLCYAEAGPLTEPCGGAPTTSIILQEMITNAVEIELISRRQFSRNDFLRNHPGGNLGKILACYVDKQDPSKS